CRSRPRTAACRPPTTPGSKPDSCARTACGLSCRAGGQGSRILVRENPSASRPKQAGSQPNRFSGGSRELGRCSRHEAGFPHATTLFLSVSFPFPRWLFHSPPSFDPGLLACDPHPLACELYPQSIFHSPLSFDPGLLACDLHPLVCGPF